MRDIAAAVRTSEPHKAQSNTHKEQRRCRNDGGRGIRLRCFVHERRSTDIKRKRRNKKHLSELFYFTVFHAVRIQA